MSNYKGSQTTLWKFLSGIPKQEVVVGMDLAEMDKQWGGCLVNPENLMYSERVLHPATWEKYYRYGWITRARTLSKKGLRTYLNLKEQS